MDVRAIIVVGPSQQYAEQPCDDLAGTPLAFADVLGKPVIFRIVEHLQAHNIRSIAVLTDFSPREWPAGTAERGTWSDASGENLWRSVELAFSDFAQSGAEIVLLLRVGPYAEINYSHFLQFHLEQRHHLTRAVDGAGNSLNIYAINAARRNDAAYLIRHQLREFRAACGLYLSNDYVNQLATPYDLRNLAIDALMRRAHLAPEGAQVRPGVWIGRGARIHRRARVLSPAFIGAGTRVRAAAVVTRCSALERHTVVDCGTVVENVTALPFTYLGAGLDVTHSVIGYRRVWNLKRNVEVAFADGTLIGAVTVNAPRRFLGSLFSFLSFLPAQLQRGRFAPSHREPSSSLPETTPATPVAVGSPAAPMKKPAPSVDAGEFPANLVIARRYGNE